jgi:hypothetical protein
MAVNEKNTESLGSRINAKGRWYWTISIVMIALSLAFSIWVDDAPALLRARAWVTQVLMDANPFKTAPSHTVLVTIDDQAFYGINKGRTPVSPAMLTKVVHALAAAGASVVAIDLDYSDPAENMPEARDDKYLSELDGLKRELCAASVTTKIVLPLALSADPNRLNRSLLEDLPCHTDLITGGVVNLAADTHYIQIGMYDQTRRQVYPSFPVAIAKAVPGTGRKLSFIESTSIADLQLKPPMAAFLNPRGVTRIPASHVLSSTSDEMRTHVQGQAALIAGAWNERVPDSRSVVDTHETPLGMQLGGFIQAAQVETLLAERIYRPVIGGWVLAIKLAWLAGLAIVMGTTENNAVKAASVAGAIAINLCLAWIAFSTFAIAVDIALPLIMLAGHPILDEIMAWRNDSIVLRSKHVET